MQNYRSNAMPYNNYRQMQPASRTTNCRMENSHMEDTRMEYKHGHEKRVLAMAYVPWQIWGDLYDADKGFHCGTIFQELNLPFLGKGGSKR